MTHDVRLQVEIRWSRACCTFGHVDDLRCSYADDPRQTCLAPGAPLYTDSWDAESAVALDAGRIYPVG